MARTQKDRPFRLKSTLGDDVLLLERFEGVERLSTAYRYTLRVLAEDPDIDMKGLLKKPLVLTIVQADKSERHIHGNIKSMSLLGEGEDGLAAYEIEIRPWFWFLQLFKDCRIFQNKSVPDIVQKVFSDRGFSDYRLDTQASYSSLEYCVQYRETDFNFVSRLLEQEGIFYYFEQTEAKVTMVMADAKESLSDSKHQSEIRYVPPEGGVLEKDVMLKLEEQAHVHTGSASVTDYDFEKPDSNLFSSLDSQDTETDGEYYDYPGKYITKSDGERYARVRLEEKEAKLVTVRADTNSMGLECGYKFTLKDHFRGEANGQYAIVALQQNGTNTSYRANADLSAFKYENHIECIPAKVPFRPPLESKKPVIRGVQTAVVVGKSGEEIWTDQYGRVKVQFFWDREGTDDEGSSCWIRVSHAWAGKLWGAIYTPRIGQEVIVSFLEGDPDRPIITGRVYNADQMPPYSLPDEQTKSTLKSMSSKGQDGFNEIRFEDLAGKEQIFIHGEKNLDVRIKNDRMEWIGNDRSLIVTNDKFEKISGNEHSHVMGNRVEEIGQDHFLNILGNQGIKVKANHSLSVQGNVVETFKGSHNLDVTQGIFIKGQQIVIEAEMGMTLKVGGNFITIDPAGIALMGTMIQLNSAGVPLPSIPGMPVPLDPPKDPVVADDASPGGYTSAPEAHPITPKQVTLAVLPAGSKGAPVDEPDRVIKAGTGGGSAPGEMATFPKDIDPAGIANGLTQASKDGTPFCEECQKSAQAAESAASSSGESSDSGAGSGKQAEGDAGGAGEAPDSGGGSSAGSAVDAAGESGGSSQDEGTSRDGGEAE